MIGKNCQSPVKKQILTSIEKKISYQKVYQGAGRGSKNRPFRPTSEQLLAVFSDLTLYLYPDGSTEISSLNSLQRQISNLMKIPESISIILAVLLILRLVQLPLVVLSKLTNLEW